MYHKREKAGGIFEYSGADASVGFGAFEGASIYGRRFFTVCLADNVEAVELILRIVLGKEVRIKSIRTQEALKNLQGRSAILDIHAVFADDKEADIEIQRSDAGAGAKRARHNSSLLDAHILKPGEDTKNIPDSYVIFVTENDVMKGGKPIYPVERYVAVGEEKVLFDDGSHIIYVNEITSCLS